MTTTRRSVLAWGVSAAALAALASCTREHAGARQFVDAAGRNVAVHGEVGRVFAAGPPASVLLYMVAPEKMLGWARAPSDAAKAYLATPYRDLPALGMLTGRANTASLEQVVSLRPNLILDCGQVDRSYASLADRVQEQTRVPYVLLNGAFAETAQTLRTLGVLLDAEQRVERQAAYAEDVNGEIASLVNAKAGRARIYYGRGAEGLETGRAGSITTELIELVADNVAVAAGEGGMTNVSPEQILSWDADIIIAQNAQFRDALFTDRRWAGLRAVRERRVFVQPSLPFGWIDAPPGVNRLLGAHWLRAILQGDANSVELRGHVRSFHDLFYHVRLSDLQIDALLQGGVW